jgi:hypothetical protein
MEEVKNRYVVYQYNDKASPSYRGCRFYTGWTKPIVQKQDSSTDIVAENVSSEEAQRLVRQNDSYNADAFLSTLPSDLRSKRTDEIIKNMIKNG